jgi:hypothetical protein
MVFSRLEWIGITRREGAGLPSQTTVAAMREVYETNVNAANPGYCATDLNGHSGFRTAQQGAEVSVHLATLGEDGPTGRSGDTCGPPAATAGTACCAGDPPGAGAPSGRMVRL